MKYQQALDMLLSNSELRPVLQQVLSDLEAGIADSDIVLVYYADSHFAPYVLATEACPNGLVTAVSECLLNQSAAAMPGLCSVDTAQRQQLLNKFGHQGCISEPVSIENPDTADAMLLVFSRQQAEFNDSVVKQVQQASKLIALAISNARLQHQLQLHEQLFRQADEGMIFTDASGRIIDVNPAFCAVTGYQRQEVLGKNPNLLSSGKQDKNFYEQMWQQLSEHGQWQGEVWNRKKSGELYAEILSITAMHGAQDVPLHYVGVFTDITQQKHHQEKLEFIANYDLLTKLPNRNLIVDRLTQAMALSQRSGRHLLVCILDVDGFKQVNTRLGADNGDQLLLDLSKRLKNQLRQQDTLARVGGDEFAIVMLNMKSVGQCLDHVERIQNCFKQPFIHGQQAITLSASIGVTIYPEDDCDTEALLRHSTQAMYQAKSLGGNQYRLYSSEDDQKALNHNQQLQTIRLALHDEQFELYYQPKVNMRTGAVIGVEALIRWQHPEQGMLSPVRFLPYIQGTEVEIEMGEWVIRSALEQIERWQQLGIALQISVNIAPYHLQSAQFVERLAGLMSRYPNINSQLLQAELLQIEVLESSEIENISQINDTLKQCQQDLGIQIALDDFGTGYSSLTHMRHLQANTIKIDQSFIRDMLDDPNDMAIVEGVIALAKVFERDIIAEGVETEAHGQMLILLGCDAAQGYQIARPMPADTIPAWLNSYQANNSWLSYGQRRHSDKEKQIKMLRLVTRQWYQRFEQALLADLSSAEHWPIADRHQCHCGRWIDRQQELALFAPDWLKQIEQGHQDLHNTADNLKQQYLQGEQQAARQGLTRLQEVIEQLEHAIGRWE